MPVLNAQDAVPTSPYVTKEELAQVTDTLLNAIEALGAKSQAAETHTAETVRILPDSAPDASINLEPKHRAIFQKYFDPADGFGANLETEDGLLFSIIVPGKFSNATPAHRLMHKVDLRKKALKPHDITAGIEGYCKLVAKNLNYNRNLQTK